MPVAKSPYSASTSEMLKNCLNNFKSCTTSEELGSTRHLSRYDLFLGLADNSKEWNSGDDQLRFRWMIYLVVLADDAESVRDAIRFEYCLASMSMRMNGGGGIIVEISRGRLPEELSGVHDTFHVSNLKKCLADASLHVPLDEIKVDKTLRFVEEPVEISDREVKRLKCSRMVVVKVHLGSKRGKIIDSKILVKVHWNSKRSPEFTWEREDYMKSKYPQLFVGRADESTS
ncbi:hypothetical protein Tco_0252325 [Tanacetum coccineum]